MNILANKKGFSLVEMLVTLIVVSLVMAALTPVITKKLKSNAITVGAGSVEQVEFEADCSKWEDCALCSDTQCSLCTKDCLDDEYVDTPPCECAKCNTRHDNCEQCISKKCKKCYGGYGLTNTNTCKQCDAGYYSDGTFDCTPSPIGKYVPTNKATSATPCPVGQYQDEIAQTSCKSCLAGTYQDLEGQTSCKTCEIDYMCTGGNNKTQCATNEGAVAGSSVCSACPTNCADCQIPGNCLKCNTNYYLSNKLCYACENTYYCDGSTNKTLCSAAWANCSTCTQSACLTCTEGYVSENGVCKEDGFKYSYTGNFYEESTTSRIKLYLKESGSFVVKGKATATIFLVGGGGGGSNSLYEYNGGGGGGYTSQNSTTLTTGTYSVTIGAGGSANSRGGTTKFNNYQAEGGYGGSGGTGGNGTGKGGNGKGNGAAGILFDDVRYGGGGGGGGSGSVTKGGDGGGGRGAHRISGYPNAVSGTENTGGGGGGADEWGSAGSGGSGVAIVIIAVI